MSEHTNQSSIETNDNAVAYNLRNEAFAGALLDPDTAIPKGVGKPNPLEARKIDEAVKRFSVYRNNVVVSLMDAMKSNFPSIAVIMGEENFNRVVRNFILDHPPSSPMMHQYGQSFPDFLSSFKPLAKSPFLADIAKAELAWMQAFHAQDAAILSPDDLQNIDPDALMALELGPHPAFHLIESQFPVFDLFNARNQWPKPQLQIGEAQSLVITRPYFECFANQVDAATALFLSSLNNSASLGEAISKSVEKYEAFEPSTAISIMLQIGAYKSLKDAHAN